MKPIIKWEISQRKTAIIWWSIGSLAMVALLLLAYPPLKHQAAQFNAAINQLPNGLRQLKSGGGARIDIADPVDYLNANLYYISLPILFIILSITRGSAVLGRDEQDRTLELLLARPVSRGRLLAGKALAVAIETLLVAIVATLVSVVLANAVGLHLASMRLVAIGVYTWLFCLSFGAIAFTLTAVGRFTKRASTAVAVLISFGGYLIASLSGLSSALKTVANFVPYHYFTPDSILRGKAAVGLSLYIMGIAVVSIIASYLGFRSRDIS
ncbi:MAG TPA: ABC transporter permease subunit [Candidatus Saccharimonadales bacterium]|nr:ABC transporter permease subunit [Candidatus Saccharimonadales bacterium]